MFYEDLYRKSPVKYGRFVHREGVLLSDDKVPHMSNILIKLLSTVFDVNKTLHAAC